MRSHYDQFTEVLTCSQYEAEMRALAEAGSVEALIEAEQRKAEQAEYRDALTYLADVEREQAEEERLAMEYLAAVEEARLAEERQVLEYLAAVERENKRQTAEAHRQGEELLRQQCGGRGGRYWYETNPVRVWLDYCNRAAPNWGGGGDLDCVDIGREVWVGDYDPHGLDGDNDGWGCESYG